MDLSQRQYIMTSLYTVSREGVQEVSCVFTSVAFGFVTLLKWTLVHCYLGSLGEKCFTGPNQRRKTAKGRVFFLLQFVFSQSV